ncbi:hypothetical protein [Segatella copri]|uniref:Uncharacterized protein n=1 Tax=Segatella copri TaxID=165179 RepID=A0A6G1VQE3_9BACT|nr:hypothetical protein [Segatella copri]MQN59354.1 hypothetical protein [Segatella copri]MQP14861.1 hypothetical protein [Segatella copri]
MKVINSKLAAIGLAAFVFASCSDSNSDPTGGSNMNVVDRTTITLASQNVDNSRVVNYKNSTAKARKFFLNTRAGSSIFPAFKDAPKEENAKQLNKEADLTNKNYAITGNKSLNFAGKTIDGATIFVHGGSTFEYDNTTKMTNTTIVLLSSATLKYTGTGEMIAQGNTVFCTDAKNKFVATGDININGELYANFTGTTNDGKDLVTGLGAIKETTAAEKAKSITPTQKITFGAHANAYIKGSIRATELNIENGASIYTTSNIFNNGTVNIKSQLGIEGFLKAQNLNVDGYLEAGKNSAIKVLGTMNVNNGAYISANYINVTNNTKNEAGKITTGEATLNLKGNSTILLNNKNVINVNNLVTDNTQGQIKLAEDNAVAVIKADKFVNNGAERILSFQTSGDNACFLFQFTKNFNGTTELSSFDDLTIQATYIDYDKTDQNQKIELKDENNKSYGYEWKGDATKLVEAKKLDLIASSENPSDGESATCIQPANGKLYVSYHTNGNKVSGGNIEVASMTEGNKKLTIEASKKAERTDYNHLIVDGNKLFLAGSQQGNGNAEGTAVGAFMGAVDITTSGISDEMVIYAIDKKTSKVDANCVAAFGTDHVLATTKGFTAFDKDWNFTNFNTTSIGKHVVTANNKLYALTEDGTLNVYNSSDMETAASTYHVGAVAPKGNKAVVAVDEANGDIYVCKGENGVAKISGSTVTENFFTCPTISAGDKAGKVKGCANGVAVDGEYVYIACGSYGVVVLDKAGNEVCHRKAASGKSANYVAVDNNGNIYVAYGQSRIQVYTITQTK